MGHLAGVPIGRGVSTGIGGIGHGSGRVDTPRHRGDHTPDATPGRYSHFGVSEPTPRYLKRFTSGSGSAKRHRPEKRLPSGTERGRRLPEADGDRELMLKAQEARDKEAGKVVQRIREIDRLLARPTEFVDVRNLEMTRAMLESHRSMAGLICCFRP